MTRQVRNTRGLIDLRGGWPCGCGVLQRRGLGAVTRLYSFWGCPLANYTQASATSPVFGAESFYRAESIP
jgi:hypothetical protein